MFPLVMPHLMVDRFTDGRWPVVGSRTRSEQNARTLSPDGALLARFMLGDGIGQIAIDYRATIDSADRIWVGWFDVGIFGGGSPSSNGVACFAPGGSVVDVPSWPEAAGLIADCYALSPAGSGVGTSPYIDFPIVRFDPGKPTRWRRSELAGPDAIAVHGTHALIAGGYCADAARLALIRLEK